MDSSYGAQVEPQDTNLFRSFIILFVSSNGSSLPAKKAKSHCLASSCANFIFIRWLHFPRMKQRMVGSCHCPPRSSPFGVVAKGRLPGEAQDPPPQVAAGLGSEPDPSEPSLSSMRRSTMNERKGRESGPHRTPGPQGLAKGTPRHTSYMSSSSCCCFSLIWHRS